MRNWALAIIGLGLCQSVALAASAPVEPPVSIGQTANTIILENGYVRAEVDKASGGLVSLKDEGREMLAVGERMAGTWSNAVPSRGLADAVLVNPAANGGRWGEVSIRGQFALDVDVRYTLARGDHGLYCCQVISHPANFPSATIARGGFGVRVNPGLFNTLQTGEKNARQLPSPKEWLAAAPMYSPLARRVAMGKTGETLIYGWDDAALQMETPVYGFTGEKNGAGIWIINPSSEYLARGGNMIQPTGCLDGRDGMPTLMNWWADEPGRDKGLSVNRGEWWSRVMGPFVLYCNDGSWASAKKRAEFEMRKWPYAWAGNDVLAPANGRGVVSGRVELKTMAIANIPFPNTPPVQVIRRGMAAQNYYQSTPAAVATTEPASSDALEQVTVGLSRDADWQSDLMNEQFWAKGEDGGKFSIANVPAGNYVLHVYSDGQMEEARLGGVTVEAGKTTDLGALTWTPPHYGLFVWQLGNADRSGAEFRHGTEPTRWALWTTFNREFPAGVDYSIGQSDPGRDWNWAQYSGSIFTIHFPLGFVPETGVGYLRIGLAGVSGTASLRVAVNNNEVSGSVRNLQKSIDRRSGTVIANDIARDHVCGSACEKMCAFPVENLRMGDNTIQIRGDGAKNNDGIMYDCLRLEIRPETWQTQWGDVPPQAFGTGNGGGSDFGQLYQGDPSGNFTGVPRAVRKYGFGG